jgi:hypothetical protein
MQTIKHTITSTKIKLTDFYKAAEAQVNDLYSSTIVRAFAYWFVVSSIFSFNSLNGDGVFTSGKCWAFFLSCKHILTILPKPYGYGESILFSTLLGILFLTAYLLHQKRFIQAHLLLLCILICKYIFLFFSGSLGNYDYYDIILQTVFFIATNEIWTLRVSFLFLYFLAGTIKIHEGWIAGTYFTTLYLGAPLIATTLVPFFTNLVTIMQVGGAFLSLHSNTIIRKLSCIYILIFHLYSTILVEYRYPITTIPLVLILFFLKDTTYENNNTYTLENIRKRLLYKNGAFLILMGCLLVLQLFPLVAIRGGQKLTLEGNDYALFMFEANHQFISTLKNGTTTLETWATYSANYRISISHELAELKNKYCKSAGKSYAWYLDHSVNGADFLRIVDGVDICKVTYQPFSHNNWIKTEYDHPQIVGAAHQDVFGNYSKTSVTVSTQGIGASPIQKLPLVTYSNLQLFLKRHMPIITDIYWVLWITNGVAALYVLFFMKTTR